MEGHIRLIDISSPFGVIDSKRQMRLCKWRPGMGVDDLVRPVERELREHGYSGPLVVLRGDRVVESMVEPVWPNECYFIYPMIAGGDVGKSIAMLGVMVAAAAAAYFAPQIVVPLAAKGGMFLTTAGTAMVQTLAVAGVTVLGGMAVSMMYPPPRAETGIDSPTYGWNGAYNARGPGNAVPVGYGDFMAAPQIINQYIEIDADGDQWAHVLLAVHEGQTNNVPTADELLANDEPLSFFDDYEVSATDGSLSPDTDALNKFQKLHNFRPFNKVLFGTQLYALTKSLCHYNGDEGSTTIVDDSSETHSWACQGSAALTQSGQFLGSACLNLPSAGDYVTTDNEDSFNIFTKSIWDFEVRFRQGTLQDSGIAGQQRIEGGGEEFYWGIFYDHTAGKLGFEQWKKTGPTTFFSAWHNASLSVDTNHHVRVARSGTTVFLYLDGLPIGSTAYATTPEAPSVGAWSQYVGRAYKNNAGTPQLFEGNCKLDEMRLVQDQNIYDLSGFTPPTEELGTGEEQIFETKGQVDGVSVVIEATNGLYQVDNDGSLLSYTVELRLSYRELGDTSWTSSDVSLSGQSRYTLRKQFDLTFPSRAIYQIKVLRMTPDDEDTTKVSRCVWIGLDELQNEFLHYPGIACVSVSLRAQDKMSGNIPIYKVKSNITSIEVPTFDGTGTQSVDPRMPGWAAFDAFVNQYSGRGLDPTRIDQTKWEEWIAWTEGLVDGSARARFNGIMDGAPASLKSRLAHVENVGRAKIVPLGGKYTVIIDKPATVAGSGFFCTRNIIPGSFELEWIPKIEKIDEFEIEFFDEERDYARNYARARASYYDDLERPPRTGRVTLIGCSNMDQALREAILRMQKTELTTRIVRFATPVEAVDLMPGDVIRVQHDSNQYTFGGGLGADVNGTLVTLDRAIELDSSIFTENPKIWVRDKDDLQHEAVVDGPFDEETQVLQLQSHIAAERFDPFIIGMPNEEIWLYRVTDFQLQKDEIVRLTAVEYLEAAYYHADYEGGAVAI